MTVDFRGYCSAPFGAAVRTARGGILLWAIPVCVFCSEALAQCQRAAFFPDAGSCKAYFGRSVAIDGDVAVVGANRDGDGASCTGAAYVYRNVGAVWLPEAKLRAIDAAPSQWFGYAVAIRGATILVGARYDDELGVHAGAVYEFQFSEGQWRQVAKFMAQDASEYDIFGSAIALAAGRAIIGAPHAGWGAAYIFERDGNGIWRQAAKLVPADTPSYEFGDSVALDGDIAVVGSPNDDDLGNWSGSAYVFERDVEGTWKQAAKLLPEDGKAFWAFGETVGVEQQTALIGAPTASLDQPGCGAVYVFDRQVDGTWVQTAQLLPADPQNSGWFGSAVALRDSVALIGAEAADADAGNSGSAYVFARAVEGTWPQTAKVWATDAADYDRFGCAVALSGTHGLVGAMTTADSDDSGRAYIFAVGPDEDGDGVMDACESPGDVNCDGAVNAFDIDPFVIALTQPWYYPYQFPDCTIVNADCNGDGTVDAFDIDPFVALLTGSEPRP